MWKALRQLVWCSRRFPTQQTLISWLRKTLKTNRFFFFSLFLFAKSFIAVFKGSISRSLFLHLQLKNELLQKKTHKFSRKHDDAASCWIWCLWVIGPSHLFPCLFVAIRQLIIQQLCAEWCQRQKSEAFNTLCDIVRVRTVHSGTGARKRR